MIEEMNAARETRNRKEMAELRLLVKSAMGEGKQTGTLCSIFVSSSLVARSLKRSRVVLIRTSFLHQLHPAPTESAIRSST
jgi:hypothetical protein